VDWFYNSHNRAFEESKPTRRRPAMTIVGIIILIILVLLAIYLFQRVRGGAARY